MKWIVLLLFGGIGLGALIGGAMWGFKRLPLFQSGLRAHGKVVAQEETISLETIGKINPYSREVKSYAPIVEFLDETGQKVRFVASTGGKGKPIIKTGTEVEVIYDPNNPVNVQISAFSQFWLGPLVVTAGGLLFLLMGLGGFFLMGSHDRSMDERIDMINRERLSLTGEVPFILGIIIRIEEKPEKSSRYVFICKARRPGARADEEFISDYFDFEPSHIFIGHKVEIYIDPNDPAVYFVKLDPLLPEIVRRRER